MEMPTHDKLMEPTLKALTALGGSGSIEEIAEEVVKQLNLPDEIASQPHNPEKSSRTEVEYRLAWARTYLKKYGLLENSERGIWAFTPKYNPQDQFSSREVVQSVRIADSARRPELPQGETRAEEVIVATPEMEADWRVILHRQRMGLVPDAFERLAMRLLRESGFVHVDVTGRSGDGGIDGKGIVKIQNILSYHVVFQCKRFRESVGAAHIRDFRGAMIGRADKGLFITTGTFTRDAVKEASRDGTSPIDLVDGESLIDMLKNLKLGVSVRMVEEVEVDADWFKGI